jgi:hypothetical protein
MKFEELIESAPLVTAVDIGANGGIVYREPGNLCLDIIEMPKTPKMECQIITESYGNLYAEDVHPFRGQGVVSIGSLMQRKGRLEGMCLVHETLIIWIQPLQWIECFTLKRSKNFSTKTLWKKHLRDMAIKLTGIESINLKTADAVLIWIWAANKELGKPMKRL